ncbi:MAG: hypothetical protein LBO69_08445 [Ignavibacteria bacterium]|jgi:hypothetical protein|nr:hypothetical protein [Ignavibacteria bacterium]
MTIDSTTNIIPILSKIEMLILDFEAFPQTELLQSVRMQLRIVIEKLRKYFQLKNILGVTNELIIIISAAIEREIILNVNDIDLLLNITDLLSNTCTINYNNISELSFLTNDIANIYIELSKQITRNLSLLKRTSYLKFDDINTNKYNVIDKNNENISNQIGVNSNNINQINTFIPSEREVKIDNNNETQKFDLKEVSQLITMLENSVKLSRNNTVTLSNEQINSIKKTANDLKQIANDSSVKVFDGAVNQFDVIDNYINMLNSFTDNNSIKNISNLQSNEADRAISINKTINYNDISFLLFKSQKLNELLLSSNNIYRDINAIPLQLNDLIKNISTNLPSKILENIVANIDKNKELLQSLSNQISDTIANASMLSKNIYEKIDELRSKPFSNFTIGIKEYVEAIADSVNKSVTLKISGINVMVTADLWSLFETIIPTVLRHIIVCNIYSDNDMKNNKIVQQSINIYISSHSGIFELIFTDNGRKSLVNQQIKLLKDTIKFAQSAGGRVFLNNAKENVIKFRFQMENCLCNYLVLKADTNYYAILPDSSEQITTKNINKYCPSANLAHLFNSKLPVSNKKNHNSKYVLFSLQKKVYKLYCDDVVGNAMLSPKRLTGVLSKVPYSLGAAQYGDKTVLILDTEQIANRISKSK